MKFIKYIVLVITFITLNLALANTTWAINAPSGLNVTTGTGAKLNISWRGVNGAIRYRLYLAYSTINDSNKSLAKIANDNISINNYAFSGIPGETYYFQVSAFDDKNTESLISTSVISDHGTVNGKEDPHSSLNSTNYCQDCHATHGAPQSAKKILRKTTEVEVCYVCHDGTGANNIKDVFSSTYKHPASCSSCHNGHRTTQANPLNGVNGVIPNNGTIPGVPNGYTPIANATSEFQVCFSCHSSFNSSFNGTTYYDANLGRQDKAAEFNPNNSSFHPVEAAGKNKSANLAAQLLNGLTASSTIKCSNCHNNNAASPKGVHGSTNRGILKLNYLTTLDPSSYNANNYALCYSCHDKQKLAEIQSYGAGARSNFTNGSTNYHYLHVYEKRYSCKECHFSPHGNQAATSTLYIINGAQYNSPPPNTPSMIINYAKNHSNLSGNTYTKPAWILNTATKIRTCNLRCHGKNHNYNYKPTYGDL